MNYQRTSEHRALRTELIRRWRPWEKSTGPKSQEGKAKASRNGFKGGHRVMAGTREGVKGTTRNTEAHQLVASGAGLGGVDARYFVLVIQARRSLEMRAGEL